MNRIAMLLGCLGLALLVAAGCEPAGQKKAAVQRVIQDVTGAMTPEVLKKTYGTPAFVIRDVKAGKYVGIQDKDLAPDATVDDTNLVIWIEGAGDSVEGFRWSAHLLATSAYGFDSAAEHLAIVVIHWSQSAVAVAEHMNRPGQMIGAALLNEMVEVHRQRHGESGHIGIVAFSAGTRVTELGFRGELPEGRRKYPDALKLVDNIAFVGSSMWCRDQPPFEPIRGRFINFINVRDTHFGDRAAFAAPAGTSPRLVEWLEQGGTLVRKPRFGVSVTGFLDLPVLTNCAQFDALDLTHHRHEMDAVRDAFKMVNVYAPTDLMAYDLFGNPLPDDEFDDYVNLAPNHYILVGRGAGGSTDVPSFKQYRPVAEEFVKEHLASAVLRGRLFCFDLKNKAKSANPLKPLAIPVPVLVPWAAMELDTKKPEEGTAPNLDPKSQPKPDETPKPNGAGK